LIKWVWHVPQDEKFFTQHLSMLYNG